MALFKKDKENKEEKTSEKEVKEVVKSTNSVEVPKNLDRVIVRPRITEKGTLDLGEIYFI